MKEIWKDVQGYEGIYQISNMGRVKSIERKAKKYDGMRIVRERYLKLNNNDDYYRVKLFKDGEKKILKVHRLVALYFIENNDNKLEVNHIDCNKKNNRIDNLEWCTLQENSKHAVNNFLKCHGENHSCAKANEKIVKYIRKLHNKNNFIDQKKLGIIYGVKSCTINNIIHNKTWRHV